MSKETIKVVEFDTNPAQTSIKDLRKQLKALKDEMANLEEGGDEFLAVANKAGELKHQLDEINESVKGASADFGDMVGNITNVAAGLVGAFSAVQGGLQAMGVENEAIEETIVRMQGLMAVVQGLSSIDDAIKAMDKLQNAITGTSQAAKILKSVLQPKIFLAISAAVAGLSIVFGKYKKKQEEAIRIQEEYNKKLAEENRIRTESKVQEYLRNLSTELRIKEAIASVNYSDDELAYNKAMLKEYNSELLRAGLELQNVISIGRNSSSWETIGTTYDIEYNKWKEYYEQLRGLVEQTEADIKVLEAKADALSKKPKTPVGDNDVIIPFEGIVDITDEINQKLEEKYDIQLEQLKRSNKSNAEKLAEEIRIEEKRLLLYQEGTLEYERQLTKISELKKGTKGVIEEALQNDRLTEMAKGWIYNEETAIETFDRISKELKLALDKDLITQEQYDTAVKNLAKERSRYIADQSVKAFASTANFVTTILDGIADQQDQNNKEGFERSKKLQIASATIQMFTGIATALAGAFTTKSGPWDIALAAIQAATIAASGILNINKIKNTTFDGGGAATPSAGAVNATIMPPVQYSNAVQGAELNGNIQNTKVFVLESDIVDTISKVSVQETENTY